MLGKSPKPGSVKVTGEIFSMRFLNRNFVEFSDFSQIMKLQVKVICVPELFTLCMQNCIYFDDRITTAFEQKIIGNHSSYSGEVFPIKEDVKIEKVRAILRCTHRKRLENFNLKKVIFSILCTPGKPKKL